MKIGFDGKRMTQNFTGLGNYSRYVLKILTENHSENQYSAYALKPFQLASDFQKFPAVQFNYPQKQLFKSYWRSFSIIKDLKRDRIDLFHGLSNEIPFSLKKAGIPSIITVHDLIFLRYPHYYSLIDRKIYEYKMRYAVNHASKIIAISESTKADLINYFDLDEDRIEVIYQNCDSSFRNRVSDHEKARIRSAYNLPDSFLLNVGTIETRKNALLAVKALKELDSNRHLVLIGRDTPYTEKLREFVHANGLVNRVHFLKNVPFTDLPGIYQLAELFIYPSEFEGFGIPIVEALSSELAVIAAKGSSLEEAGGPGSIYISSDNHLELAAEISNVLNNPQKKNEMIQTGLLHLQKFSDHKIADQLNTLYQKSLHVKRRSK